MGRRLRPRPDWRHNRGRPKTRSGRCGRTPLATAIRAVLAPEFAAFADPLHPGRILVARRGGDGRPDAKRVAAAIEQRETLDVLNPIFRDPPADPEQWRAD